MKRNNRSEETKDWVYIINYYLPDLQYKCTNKKGIKVITSIGGFAYQITPSTSIYNNNASTNYSYGGSRTTISSGSSNISAVTYTPPTIALSTVPGEVATFIHFTDPKYPELKYPYFTNGFGITNTFQDYFYKFLLSVKILTPIQEVLQNSGLPKQALNKVVAQITKSCTW